MSAVLKSAELRRSVAEKNLSLSALRVISTAKQDASVSKVVNSAVTATSLLYLLCIAWMKFLAAKT